MILTQHFLKKDAVENAPDAAVSGNAPAASAASGNAHNAAAAENASATYAA